MLPKERVIAALEHRPFDQVPVGEIGVDYPITDRVLGHKTLHRAKWREYEAYWQGRRDEIVTSYKVSANNDTARFAKYFWGMLNRGVYLLEGCAGC